MDRGWLVVLGVLCALLAGALVVTLIALLRGRRRLADDLAASREELSAVQRRLDGLARRVEVRSATAEQEFVITTAGRSEPVVPEQPALEIEQLTGRQFATVALGESLVTVLSFGHGVRRALSAENRNRIGFEMRREVRRSRKQRKRELREARRSLRSTPQADVEDAA